MSAQASDSVRKSSFSNLNRQAGQYSLAAAIAGVGMMALASPAAAEVVVTRANLPLNPGAGISIDLNHDGVSDFYFLLSSYKEFGPSFECNLQVSPVEALSHPTGGVVATKPAAFGYMASALALERGAKIGPAAHFSSSPPTIIEDSFGKFTNGHTTSRNIKGHWGNNPRNHYLGVKFQFNGESHYGWVRIDVTMTSQVLSIRGTITAYAYETVANKPILAGTAAADVESPREIRNRIGASLGMLALGTDALPIWRREETSANVATEICGPRKEFEL